MSKRKVANPLALAVLGCVFERPMHPYEIATTLRERHKDDSIRLNYGSLYTVVQGLQRHKLIDPLEVQREGNRPERTVFKITDAGRLELMDWLSELLCTPTKEYTQFEAGLSFLPLIPPSDAVTLLRQRCERIEIELAQGTAIRDYVKTRDLPRLFWIEHDYRVDLRKAELAFVQALIADIEAGTFDGLSRWRAFHSGEGGADGAFDGTKVLALSDAKSRRSRKDL